MKGSVDIISLGEFREAVNESEIVAEATADILWEYEDFAGLLQGVHQRSADLFLILLNILLTRTNCIVIIRFSNKETRSRKGQIYSARRNNITSCKRNESKVGIRRVPIASVDGAEGHCGEHHYVARGLYRC